MAATRLVIETIPVRAAKPPSRTNAAVIGFPSSSARLLAGTPKGRASSTPAGGSMSEELNTITADGRRRGRMVSQCSALITNADQADDATGRARSGAIPTVTSALVIPPRMPPA